ncbi:MAG: DUF6516 family protein [bacterium]
MYITDYFKQIEKILSECPAIIMQEVTYDQRTSYLGFIKGILTFIDFSQLHFKEFIDTSNPSFIRYKYGYHYQRDQDMIFRYDNYIHPGKPDLPIHHKHLFSSSDFIAVPNLPTLDSILKEIISILK